MLLFSIGVEMFPGSLVLRRANFPLIAHAHSFYRDLRIALAVSA